MSKAEQLADYCEGLATDIEVSHYTHDLLASAALLRAQDAAIKLAVGALDSQKLDVTTRLQHHENIRADDDQYEDPEEWALRDALKELNTAIAKLWEVQG
jgi:hypothetical protein